MLYYAEMVQKGQGVKQDLVQAVFYYKMAVDKGNVKAQKPYEKLYAQCIKDHMI